MRVAYREPTLLIRSNEKIEKYQYEKQLTLHQREQTFGGSGDLAFSAYRTADPRIAAFVSQRLSAHCSPPLG